MFSKKRMISLVISCVLVTQILTSTMFNLSKVEAASLDSTSTQSVEESKESTRIGDVDGNGEVNSIDFARMRMMLLGMIDSFPVSNGTWAAEVSGDGVFNSIDFAFMRKYMLGIITKFPAESNNVTPTPSVSVTTTPTDAEPPLKPEGLDYSSVTDTTVSIYWKPSTDSDVKDYAVFINGYFEILTNGATECTITDLLPNETYKFTVKAIDAANNKSELSNICTVTTKVSDIEALKNALIRNFSNKGTNYSLTYDGEVTDLQAKINQAIVDAVDESNEPFMLSDLSWSTDGYLGNLQIKFEFVYDDKNEYMAVARTNDELQKALLLGFYNRTQDINIIYKGTITENEINSAKETILSSDTYLNACINSCEGTIVSSNRLGINAIKLNCSYKTTKEQEDYIDSTVEFIVSKLTNVDMSDDEKEKLIHDYIVTNVDYCEEEKYGNAYSALYYGKTKCDGYAMLTHKMLKAAGIENIIVTNEDHAWNVVKIDNKWYHFDTTWNDGKKKDYGYYKYYNKTDSEILESRNYSNVYGIECTSDYIADLTERNTKSDGKYGELLKDFEQNDDYYFVNSFNSNASLTLLYNEVVLKEWESISLIDDKIPTELYENSYQWSTSDPDVATVTNGIITAKKAGTIMISAQPMYDMLSTSSLFCKVHVVPVNSEDGKTQQVLSKENISGITDTGMQLQLTINSKDDINSTTTVTNARDSLEGKIWFVGDPVNITSTSEFDWAEIGFKLSEEQLASYDLNDLAIYWYDEETGTMVPQATTVNEESGVISATVTHFSTYVVSSRKISDLTTTLAFVIDSKYSKQTSLDTFKESICSTIAGLRKKSNVRAIFIDAKTNKTIRNSYYPSEGVYTGSSNNPAVDVDSAFKEITPGGMTPSNQEILATVNSGMTSGNEELDKINVSGFKNNKYILFYTNWDAFFVDNNAIIKKMGDTIGLVIGNTVGYYAGGPISYKQTDVNPLVEFLLEGNYTQVSISNTNKTPWVLKLDGNNIENDVIVLQKVLVSLGLLEMPINPNTNTYVEFGTYASRTEAAVKKFQESNIPPDDGKVGKNTWKKLSLPWDEENAQPDRNSWSYKYILQNNKFYTQRPQIKLSAPTNGTKFIIGDTLTISASGDNCHHLAIFINGEWKVTVSGNANTSAISINYDYKIPSTGTYTIQVKGRNIPGSSGGILAESEIVKVEVTEPGITNEDIEIAYAYFKVLKKYENVIWAIESYGTGLPSGSYGVEVDSGKIIEEYKQSMLYIQFLLLQNPVIKENSSVSTTLINSLKNEQPVREKEINSLINTLKSSNATVKSIFTERDRDDLWPTSLGYDLLPGIGDAKGVIEGITGYDLLTKKPLAWWEKALGFVCLSELRKVGNVSDIIKKADNASDIMRAIDAASDSINYTKSKIKLASSDFLNSVKGSIIRLSDGIGFRPALSGIEDVDSSGFFAIINKSDIGSNLPKVESIASNAGRLAKIDEIAPDIANLVKNVNKKGTLYELMDETGKVLRKVVVPEGFSSSADLLRKAYLGTVDITKWGYKNPQQLEEVISNLNKYLNDAPDNAILNSTKAGTFYKGVEFDPLGFPIFKGDNLLFEFDLPENLIIAADKNQFSACTEALGDAIRRGEIPESKFTIDQLKDITDGDELIDGLTWHHNQVKGKMQLVPTSVHNVNHLGGNAIWGGGIR